MTKSFEDLKAAFAGESQANRRYLAYAKKADEEGYPQVARLFRAIAAAETVHALTHLRVMDGVHSTAENLKAAMGGENYEVTVMYSEFMQDAEAEGDKRAHNSFRLAWEVEKIHEGLYKQAIENLGKDGEEKSYYVCPVCGYTHEGTPPEKCPVCNASSSRFEKID